MRYVSLQFLLFGLYLLVPVGRAVVLPPIGRYAALGVAVAGVVLALRAVYVLRASLSVFPEPKAGATLITHGPFRYVRHPIYSGLLLVVLGIALYTGHGGRLGVALLLAILFWYKAAYEEARLANVFPGYATYRKRTGRLWPRFGGRRV